MREITDRLLASTHAERAAIPSRCPPGRVDVIAAGALVLLAIMERIGAAEVVVSEHDILDDSVVHRMRLTGGAAGCRFRVRLLQRGSLYPLVASLSSVG